MAALLLDTAEQACAKIRATVMTRLEPAVKNLVLLSGHVAKMTLEQRDLSREYLQLMDLEGLRLQLWKAMLESQLRATFRKPGTWLSIGGPTDPATSPATS